MTKPDPYQIERRDFFAGIAGGAAFALGAGMLGAQKAHANWGLIAPGPVPGEDFDGRSLVNKPRAYEVMEQEGVDGIVALNPVNVFYLGNYFSYEVQKLRAIPSFAVMPRDPGKPSFLVVASTDLWFIANAEREYPEIIPYSAPVAWEKYRDPETWNQPPESRGGIRRPIREESLTDIERGWVEMERRYENRKAATPEWALIRALEEAGLEKGRVAVDDMSIAHILSSLGRTGSPACPATTPFARSG